MAVQETTALPLERETGRDLAAASEGEGRIPLSALQQAILYLVLGTVSILMFFPFLWMIATALRPAGFEADLSLIPRPYLAFENFGRAWSFRGSVFTQYAINSVVIAVVSTALGVALNGLAGFAFAKYSFPGRNVLFYIVLTTMMVPFQITMIPTYVTIAKLGLINNYWGVILPGTASAFGIFLIRQFMQSIPDELLDAARIDGASEVNIFLRIVVPLSAPALAVLAIFTFLWRWNDYLLPLLVMNRQQMFTLPIGVTNFIGEYRAEWSLVMAVSLISILPTVGLFLFFQRYFVRGIAMTGMKG
ncbi:MAG TPA: carbohydrate ABC transporter permease [Chloroflexota bacterium]|nr:carbohydrate ABC transporter permease [Chloroflexota bacterium]